jgi:regulatory protein
VRGRAAVAGAAPAAAPPAARRLVRKKLPSLRKVDSTTATRRLVGMLARKGYSAGLAFAVVKDELGAAASGDDEADDF